jgi:hypothetical protein
VVHLRPGRDGIWHVGVDGRATAMRDMKGLHHLRVLLARPGIEIDALELSDRSAGHPGSGVVDGGLGDVIDRRALRAYRTRLAELDEDLDEARTWADEGRADRLRHEREALLQQVAAATGLHGRIRPTTTTQERARVAVRKAVAAALDRISRADPAVGRLLRDTVRTGTRCRYDPDPTRPVRWVLDAVHPPSVPGRTPDAVAPG